MSEPHVVAALKDKRAELAGTAFGLIPSASVSGANMRQRRVDMHQVCPVPVDPFLEVGDDPRRRNAWFGKGECARLVYGILRTAARPMTSREIAEALMADRGLDPADHRSGELIQKTVHGVLKRAVHSVVAATTDGQALAWRVAD